MPQNPTDASEITRPFKNDLFAETDTFSFWESIQRLSHNCNNALTAVVGTSEMLWANPDLSYPLRGELEIIRDQARRATTLAQSLSVALHEFSEKQAVEERTAFVSHGGLVAHPEATIFVSTSDAHIEHLLTRSLKSVGGNISSVAENSLASHLPTGLPEKRILAILDLRTPLDLAPEDIRSLHKTNPTLRVLCLTGNSAETAAHLSTSLHNLALIEKPFSIQLLRKRVSELLA